MQEKKNPPKTIRVELRSAVPALKIAVILLILFSMAALVALRWVHNGIRAQTEGLRGEAAAIEYANTDLEEKIQQVDSVQGIQNIAKEELGLIDPNTILIEPKS